MVSVKVLAGAVALMLVGPQPQQATAPQPQTTGQQTQTVPDAPHPQVSLPTADTISPGMGTSTSDNGSAAPAEASPVDADTPENLPSSPAPQAQSQPPSETDGEQQTETPAADVYSIKVRVNYVEIPFTVKDRKGNLVPGLTWRDVQVYENNIRQQIRTFTVDPRPLSVALVIDQSMTIDNMTKVNNALRAVQGAFAPYDEMAVFTYNNFPKLQTELTGAQSARLTFVLEASKAQGREPLMPLGGPMSQTNLINNQVFDPNTAPVHNSSNIFQTPPKERHALNDAILEAAKSLSKVDSTKRRKIVYVISDGAEYGSTAKTREVIRYLQANQISVYGTLVGNSSLPVVGFLDRIHLPLTMRDNVLPAYAEATGGSLDAQFRQRGIEQSFADIAREVRTQYVVGYYSHEPFIDGKFRPTFVVVLHPDLTVISKKGYYPTAGGSGPTNIVQEASH